MLSMNHIQTRHWSVHFVFFYSHTSTISRLIQLCQNQLIPSLRLVVLFHPVLSSDQKSGGHQDSIRSVKVHNQTTFSASRIWGQSQIWRWPQILGQPEIWNKITTSNMKTTSNMEETTFVKTTYTLREPLLWIKKISNKKTNSNTSPAALGALDHCLQRRTACNAFKIQNGC